MARLRTLTAGELMDAGLWEKFLATYETEPDVVWERDDRVVIHVEHAIEWGLLSGTY